MDRNDRKGLEMGRKSFGGGVGGILFRRKPISERSGQLAEKEQN